MARWGVCAVVMCVWSAGAMAAGDEVIEFAVPDEGRVTLGVFDSSGRLVRTLHRLATEEAFEVGVNGFITKWDGRDDGGAQLPSGHYHVRGYLVGDVVVSGEAKHFNDWIASDADPLIVRIHDFAMAGPVDVVIVASVAGGGTVVARYSAEGGCLWRRDIPAGSGTPVVAVGGGRVFVAKGGDVLSFDAASGEPGDFPPGPRGAEVAALAVDAGKLYLAAGRAIAVRPFGEGKEDGAFPTPVEFSGLAVEAAGLAGVGGEKLYLRRGTAGFSERDVPVPVLSIAPGLTGSLWFVGRDGGQSFVGELSAEGALLRKMTPGADDLPPRLIRTWGEADGFAVLEEATGAQRVRVMSRLPDSGWTIEWARSVLDVSGFGFDRGGGLVASGGESGSKELEFRLDENPLTGLRGSIRLRAVSDAAGTRIETADRLPLFDLGARGDSVRTLIQRGSSGDSLRVFCGNGSFVDEYSVTGLRHILPIDAGGVDLP